LKKTSSSSPPPPPSSSSSSLAIVKLDQCLTRSGFALPGVSSVVSPRFFCLSVSDFFFIIVICYEDFCLHFFPSFFCSPEFCPNWDYIYFFYNPWVCFMICLKCILKLFSYIPSLLLLFFLHLLL
jgi:hypothetical protein